MGNTTDYNGPYDVAEVQQGNFSGSGRVYLAHKATSPTTFYSDAPIAAVQILSSGGSVLQTWAFNTSTGGSGSTWTEHQPTAITIPNHRLTCSTHKHDSIQLFVNVNGFINEQVLFCN